MPENLRVALHSLAQGIVGTKPTEGYQRILVNNPYRNSPWMSGLLPGRDFGKIHRDHPCIVMAMVRKQVL